MREMLFKRVIKLLTLVVLLIFFTANLSFAVSMDDPLCSVIVNRDGSPKLIKDMSGQWTNPILVASNEKAKAFTGGDTITGNLFWGNIYADFLRTGNFVAQVYVEIKDKTLSKEIVKSLKSAIAKQPSLVMTGHPDLFTYLVFYGLFDMKNNLVSLNKWEKYLDRDGNLIILQNVQEDHPLDDNPFFKLIADGILSSLNTAKKDSKISDKIREMQEYGSNMTDVSRYDSVRNALAARKQSPMGKSGAVDTNNNSRSLTSTDLYSKLNALYDSKTGQYTNPAKAIDYLDEIIRRALDLANSYFCRGVAYYGLGQYQLAINDYDQAIQLKPDFVNAFGNRGLAYGLLGNYQQEIKDYNEAIRLNPNEAMAYYNRGYAYLMLKLYDKAISDYNEAIRLKMDNANIYTQRGGAYNGLGQYQRAITDLNEAIRLKSDFANPYRHRGNSYRNLGKYQQAIQDYDEAIRLKPNYAEAHSDRGLAYINLGNNPDGCRSLVRACELEYCKDYDLSKQKGDCQ